MTVQFAGAICTIARLIPIRVRICAAAMAIGAPLLSALALTSSNWWLQVVAVAAVVCGAVPIVLLLWPNTCIVFDAQAKTISICRWQPLANVQRTRTLPFSAVFSIGLTIRRDEAGRADSHIVELRLNGGRNLTLWTLASGPGADADLIDLLLLTGLPREDRLS